MREEEKFAKPAKGSSASSSTQPGQGYSKGYGGAQPGKGYSKGYSGSQPAKGFSKGKPGKGSSGSKTPTQDVLGNLTRGAGSRARRDARRGPATSRA